MISPHSLQGLTYLQLLKQLQWHTNRSTLAAAQNPKLCMLILLLKMHQIRCFMQTFKTGQRRHCSLHCVRTYLVSLHSSTASDWGQRVRGYLLTKLSLLTQKYTNQAPIFYNHKNISNLTAYKLILWTNLAPSGEKKAGAAEMKTPCVYSQRRHTLAMSDLTTGAVAGYHITT